MCSRVFKVSDSSCNPFFHSLDRYRNSPPDNRWQLQSDHNQGCLFKGHVKSCIEPINVAQKTFSVCPNCAFTIRNPSITNSTGRRGTVFGKQKLGSGSLPTGINPALLLDSSPTPQLLLSNHNKVAYANKSATSLLGCILTNDDDPTVSPPLSSPRLRRQSHGRNSWIPTDVALIPDHDSGIEGLHMEDLPIELARADINKWITLDQVLKNVKNAVQKKQEQDAYGFDARAYDDFYAETGKKDEDYYEDQFRASGKQLGDGSRKETIPVIITKRDGELLSASLYVSILGSNTAGSAEFIALSIVPNSDGVDAGFNPITRRNTSKRQQLKTQQDGPTGAGADVLEKVAKLKDMILDEVQFSFACLTPDGDIVITNKACRELLGEEALKPPVG